MKNNFKNYLYFGTVFLLLGLAIFLRVYKFEDYLHFKWDQARDLMAVSRAVEKGPQELPLLGPRAVKMEVDGEKEQLRLGPGYFYAQYFFSSITNSQEPQVFAYFELTASVLSLIMLFFFCRLFLSNFYSLSATVLYSFSLMAIQFSRFAWNPNSLPLFALICYYAVVKFFRVKTLKQKIILFSIWSLSFAIAGQLHYMGLFLISAISGLYVFYKLMLDVKISGFKKYTSKKNALRIFFYAVIFLAIFLFINIPLILSEIAYGGENSKNFIPAFSTKSEDDNLIGKTIKNFKVHGDKYFTILTGVYFEKEMINFNVFYFGFAMVMIPAVFLIFIYFRGNSKDRDLCVFLLICLMGYFVLTIPIAFKHYLRYFLVIFPFPFVAIIFFTKYLIENSKPRYYFFIWLIPLLLLGSNLYKTSKWFSDLKMVQSDQSPFFKEVSPIKNRGKDDVTLGQLRRAVDYIYKEKGEGSLLTFSSASDYKISFEYLFYLKDKELFYDFDGGNGINPFSKYYFFISTKEKKEAEIPTAFFEKGRLIKTVIKGQLVIYKFELNKPYDSRAIEAFIKSEKEEIERTNHYKITIKDFFSGNYIKNE